MGASGGAGGAGAAGAPPWATLDPALGPPLRAILPGVVEEVLEAVREVPAYAQPLEGSFGRIIRVGVEQALGAFVELIESGPGVRLPGREVYVQLGRGEVNQGRSLEALLAAYRGGAQVAWRRFAEAASANGAEPQTIIRLAEAVFAFIDELSAASAEGHAEATALQAGERHDRRRQLLELLLQGDPPTEEALAEVAAAAAWRIPKNLAVVVFDGEQPLGLTARLPHEVLIGEGHAVVPAPIRAQELEAAFTGVDAALGPLVAPRHAARSHVRATLALPLATDTRPFVTADDHLLDLLLRTDPQLAAELGEKRLAPLDALPKRSAERMRETLQAWLDHQGEVRPAAEELHVHVQTVRYRVGRLKELFGDALDDPTARLELALALRTAEQP